MGSPTVLFPFSPFPDLCQVRWGVASSELFRLLECPKVSHGNENDYARGSTDILRLSKDQVRREDQN